MKRIIFLLLIIIGCTSKDSSFIITDEYLENTVEFRNKLSKGRVEYLQLAGLFKLNDLENSLGTDSTMQFTITSSPGPAYFGSFFKNDDTLFFHPNTEIEIQFNDKPITGSVGIYLDENGNSPFFQIENFKWRIITRSEELYIRVWDQENPAVHNFQGFKWFELNPEFVFDAEFKYYETPVTIEVPGKLGYMTPYSFIGQVTFTYKGKEYSLDTDQNGFLMVGDKTSASQTYGGGRYMYVVVPEKNGVLELDFNKLYNPPCAYSVYTTCLFPHQGNILPFEILAGETNEQISSNQK